MALQDIPQTMRAWVRVRKGEPTQVLKLVNIPVPTDLKPDEILVKVSHVSLNAGMLIGIRLLPQFISKTWIPEMECSGTVVKIGSPDLVNGLKVGDTILGGRERSEAIGNGSLVDFMKMKADLVVKVPQNISMVEASGVAGCGCTAEQALALAGVRSGQKVLINGGSGGLGSILVQVAKDTVGESGVVVATCSGPNINMVKGLGADEVIDYTAHKPLDAYLTEKHNQEPFDAIFDTVGADNVLYTKSPAYLTPKGTFVLLGGMGVNKTPSWFAFSSWIILILLNIFTPTIMGGIPRKYRFYSATVRKDSLEHIRQLCEDGKLKVPTDSIWKMEDVPKAYDKIDSQRAKGKIVIAVQG